MRSFKRALSTVRGNEFQPPNNPVYLIKRHLSHSPKDGDRVKGTCGRPQPCVMLESELFLDFKGHFYRGMDVRDLCRRATFDEVIFLLLHKRLPNGSELKRANCFVQKELDRFGGGDVLQVGRLLKASSPLELIRIALLEFSHQGGGEVGGVNSDDPVWKYLKILAASLRLLLRWGHPQTVSPRMRNYADLASFLIDAYPQGGAEKQQDGEGDVEGSHQMKDPKGGTRTPHPWRREKIKLLNAFLLCMCEQGINEYTFFIRMLSSVDRHDYFGLCLSASTFYIDAFRHVDLCQSLEGFLTCVVTSAGGGAHGHLQKGRETEGEQLQKRREAEGEQLQKRREAEGEQLHRHRQPAGEQLPQEDHSHDEAATPPSEDFFFHKANRCREKNAILKEHLNEYCNSTSEENLLCLHHFEQLEEFLLKRRNRYASCYYYPLLIFHLVGLPLPLLPPVFFLMRLLSFTAHRQEQIRNNKLVRYAGVYVGEPPGEVAHRGGMSPP
ncbi:citrate synthase-like protein, putative [Plasmodium vivax]|nr:citrate synthase-like protein, putative [Plasmodium vivax]